MEVFIKDNHERKASEIGSVTHENTLIDKKSKRSLIISYILFIEIPLIIFALCVFYQNHELKNELNNTNKSIVTLESELTNYEESIELLEIANGLCYIATDNFLIERAAFDYNGSKCILNIKMNTQPDYSGHYLGKGKFDIDNGNLKSGLLNLLNCVKDYYNSNKTVSIKDFYDIKIYLTIKNYNLGIYENGELKLTGE